MAETPLQVGAAPPETALSPPTGFLSLPLELRQQIYAYVLPTTCKRSTEGINRRKPGVPYCWRPGNASLLRVNKLIHGEALEILYANLTCVISVSGFGTQFEKVQDDFDFTSVRYHAFPTVFGDNVSRIRRFVAVVEWDDELDNWKKPHARYRTAIENHGLNKALKWQMKMLCDVLGRVEMIQSLHVHVLSPTNSAPGSAPGRAPGRAPRGARSRRDWLGMFRPLEELRNVCEMRVSRVDKGED